MVLKLFWNGLTLVTIIFIQNFSNITHSKLLPRVKGKKIKTIHASAPCFSYVVDLIFMIN